MDSEYQNVLNIIDSVMDKLLEILRKSFDESVELEDVNTETKEVFNEIDELIRNSEDLCPGHPEIKIHLDRVKLLKSQFQAKYL